MSEGPPVVPAGGRVLGVGVDLVDVERVRESLRRFPERFTRRVLSSSESAYCLSRADPAPHVAARFAAKEAVIKCLGGGCALNEIEVVRALSGSPSITLHGRALARAQGASVLISLSHLDNLAAAFATLIDCAPVGMEEAPLTIRETLRVVAEKLEAGGIERSEAVSEARVIVQHGTHLTREAMRIRADHNVSAEAAAAIFALTARRAAREPLAYLLGQCAFYGLDFHVSPAVLIPRPETEFVVDAVLEHIADRPDSRIADLGTGSGVIAIAIATRKTDALLWATDISLQALEVARQNVTAHSLNTRVRLAHGDLLAPIASSAPFDAIASNPPYIAPEEIARLEPEVRDWEPCIALGTHADPLHFYRRLAAEAPPLLKPGGMLVVEVGIEQADAVADLWRAAGLADIRIIPDYAGIPRVVSGLRPA